MNPYRSVVLLLLATLSACTTTSYGERRENDGYCNIYVDERRLLEELARQQSCCPTPKDIPVLRVTLGNGAVFGLLRDSMVYEFSAGKSRVFAFHLDPAPKSKYLLVQPIVAGRTTLAPTCETHQVGIVVGDGSERYRAIEPILTFLDATGSVVSSAVEAKSSDIGDYRVAVPPQAAVVILHTDPRRYGAEKRLFLENSTVNVLLPGTAGPLPIRGPGSVATLVTATGFFTLAYSD